LQVTNTEKCEKISRQQQFDKQMAAQADEVTEVNKILALFMYLELLLNAVHCCDILGLMSLHSC
jgi:hypothetical protein